MSDLQTPGSDEVSEPRPALPPPGPGDDDPRSVSRGVAADAVKPLGPGDDDLSRVDRGTAASAGPPPGPGDGPEATHDMLALPAPGPGDASLPARRLTVFAKKVAATESVAVESSTRRSRRPTQEKEQS